MRHALVAIMAVALCMPSLTTPTRAAGEDPAKDRLEALEQARKASAVLNEIMGIKEEGIPEALLADAEVIAVFPDVVKAAFIFAARAARASFRPGTRRPGGGDRRYSSGSAAGAGAHRSAPSRRTS